MSDAVTVRLDEAALGALDRLAEKTDLSRDLPATQAIEDYVALNIWAVDRIEAGLAAADASDFASAAEVARVAREVRSTGVILRWTVPAAARIVNAALDRTALLTDPPLLGRSGRVAGTRELVISGTPFVAA